MLSIQVQTPGKTKAESSEVGQPTIRKELLERLKQDQAIRMELIQQGIAKPSPKLLERMEAIDKDNVKWLEGLIAKQGWPTVRDVGRDGVEAAFLITQHAELGFQVRMLPMVEKSFQAGELSGQSFALLTDRINVRQGKPQLFGTQTKSIEQWNGKEPVFEPIEDEANLDARRKSVGLFPMEQYIELLKSTYFPEQTPKK